MPTPKRRRVEVERAYTRDLRTLGRRMAVFIWVACTVVMFVGGFVATMLAGPGRAFTLPSFVILLVYMVVSAFAGMRLAMTYQVRKAHLLRQPLQVKCERVYGHDLMDVLLVGVSPGWGKRNYEGDYSWDVGFMVFEGGRMRYFGDRTDFELSPGQVVGVESASDAESIFPRLDVIWQRAPGADRHVLGVYVRDSASPRGNRRRARGLLSGIESFREGAGAPLPTGDSRLPARYSEVYDDGPWSVRTSLGESVVAFLVSIALLVVIALALPATQSKSIESLIKAGQIGLGSIVFGSIRSALSRRHERSFMERWGVSQENP